MKRNEQLVEVGFDLPRVSEQWPPGNRECLWAQWVTADAVRLRNVPSLAYGVAWGDLFRVHRAETGDLLAGKRLHWSGHCTIRVFVNQDGPLNGSLQRVSEMFAPLGVAGEGSPQWGLLAFDVPPEVDVVPVQRLLKDGVREDWWDYEEACVGAAWIAADEAEA
ncbi:DUF4265 domain-containing protein [Actinoplanes sp. TFC3]|uniref:DUF4265 domain-containing protein n=1 Tax=Actinoplanes sp. TFC3 TaxID=1710355 RepID=UPI001379BD1B|nr:DUF4265 domain-containing protein [Actinoplanes sp. TFC3]